MGNRYLCHLIFTLSKFTFKNFIFFKIVSDTIVSLFYFGVAKHFPFFYSSLYYNMLS